MVLISNPVIENNMDNNNNNKKKKNKPGSVTETNQLKTETAYFRNVMYTSELGNGQHNCGVEIFIIVHTANSGCDI
jgi:hypothetical protein